MENLKVMFKEIEQFISKKNLQKYRDYISENYLDINEYEELKDEEIIIDNKIEKFEQVLRESCFARLLGQSCLKIPEVHFKDVKYLIFSGNLQEDVKCLRNLIYYEQKLKNKNINLKIKMGEFLEQFKDTYCDGNVKVLLSYFELSRSEVYFQISLFKLSLEFPMIKHLNINIRDVKSKLKLLRQALESNPEFWSKE